MIDSFKNFSRGFTIFSVVILLISLAVYLWIAFYTYYTCLSLCSIVFYGFTLIVFRLLDKTKERRLSKFANAYMLVNFGKLVFFTIIIFVYAYFKRTDAVSFIITFFIYYLLFTSYEIIALLKK